MEVEQGIHAVINGKDSLKVRRGFTFHMLNGEVVG